jgi:hypothetical protein
MEKIDLYLREAFAYNLNAFMSTDDVKANWYGNAEYRKTAREKADVFIKALNDSGVKLSKLSSQALTTTITDLQTIPSQKAYTDDELK